MSTGSWLEARATTPFAVFTALWVVFLRLLLFESGYFAGAYIPNHDMTQGLAFFGTSVHNLRLTGEIVWWNPIASEGYAQYYQSFLAPLSPTQGNIVFVVWSEAVRLCAVLGLPTPSEYMQYLTVNYLVLPFLAYWALGELARTIVVHRVTVFAIVGTFALSGIGLWNGAWFYFQEAFTLLFFLAAFVRAVQGPTPRAIALLSAAILVQITSVNYWTIFNAPFLVMFLGTFTAFQPRRVGRLAANLAALLVARRVAALAALAFIVTAALWILLITSIVTEQAASYVRADAVVAATLRVKPIRHYTSELFNPGLEIAIEHWPALNPDGPEPPIHNARYLGAALLPLLAILPFARFPRRARWLLVLSLELFVFCLHPRFLADPLARVPFLSQIQHLFYFYTAHFQLAVTLLSGLGLDAIVSSESPGPGRMRLGAGVLAVMAACMAAVAFRFRHLLPGVAQYPSYYVRGFGLVLASALLAALALNARARVIHRAATALLVGMHLVDLGAYFSHGSEIDREFTSWYRGAPFPMTDEYRRNLLRPMRDPDPSLGASAGLERDLGVRTTFWPVNRYLLNVAVTRAEARPDVVRSLRDQALDFFPTPPRDEDGSWMFEHGPEEPAQSLDASWLHWGYNDAAFRVLVPRSGWLFFRRIHDPLWQLTVDGQERAARPANHIGTAVPVEGGTHEIHLSYRPLARSIYRPACGLLVVSCGFLLWAARARRTPRKDEVTAMADG